jgi:hypothetical protein
MLKAYIICTAIIATLVTCVWVRMEMIATADIENQAKIAKALSADDLLKATDALREFSNVQRSLDLLNSQLNDLDVKVNRHWETLKHQ